MVRGRTIYFTTQCFVFSGIRFYWACEFKHSLKRRKPDWQTHDFLGHIIILDKAHLQELSWGQMKESHGPACGLLVHTFWPTLEFCSATVLCCLCSSNSDSNILLSSQLKAPGKHWELKSIQEIPWSLNLFAYLRDTSSMTPRWAQSIWNVLLQRDTHSANTNKHECCYHETLNLLGTDPRIEQGPEHPIPSSVLSNLWNKTHRQGYRARCWWTRGQVLVVPSANLCPKLRLGAWVSSPWGWGSTWIS